MKNRFINTESKLNVRSDEAEKEIVLEGYFIRYNEETKLADGIYEMVSRDAVTNSLENNDIVCLFNHDSSFPLGRVSNGTFSFENRDDGLFGSVTINANDNAAKDVASRVKRGDINACSFGFNIIDEDMVNKDDDSTLFVLKDIDLREVSIVTFPAYPTTVIQARNEQIEEHHERKLEKKKQNLFERLEKMKGRSENA